MDHGAVLADFLAVTGADQDHALSTLEASDWNLETAVGLFFASGGHDHQAHDMGPAGGAAPKPAHQEDDAIRAPIASKVDRLYGDVASGVSDRFAGIPMTRATQRQQQPVDVFRDYKAEGEAGSSKEGSGAAGLSGLFAAPTAITFKTGRFQEAKAYASDQGRWLMVNIQSANEFASHRLNRDTWSNSALQEMVNGSFVFYQIQDTSDEGQALQTSYRVHELPSIMMIDPITGAKLYERTGYVDAEALIEVLVQFMEHGPKDPGAGQLAHTMSLKRKAPGAAAAKAATVPPLSEDEQLARAIAMSMEQQGGTTSQDVGSGGGVDSDEDDDGIDEAAIWEEIRRKEAAQAAAAAKPKPEEVMAAAKARLPPEPEDTEPGRCRIAFRFPDGSRVNRKFLRTHTVQALYDFVLSTVQEAADGQVFTITPGMPGAAGLTDRSAELQAVGVADALVAVRWG